MVMSIGFFNVEIWPWYLPTTRLYLYAGVQEDKYWLFEKYMLFITVS